MLVENMNATTSFIIVALVATHGIIGNETSLDSIEELTDDSLGLTTEIISRIDDVQTTSAYLEENINATEQATGINDSTGAEIRAAKRDSYDKTTEDSPVTTEHDHTAPNNDNSKHLKTSITHKATTDRQTPIINVKERILKQSSKLNETELSKHASISDKNITSTTKNNESLKEPLVKLVDATEQSSDRPIAVVGDKKDDDTLEHEALTDMENLLKSPDDNEMELTTNFRRMLSFDPVVLESRTGNMNNVETATVAKINYLPRPFSSTQDYFTGYQENGPKAYGNRQQYSTPMTSFISLETSTLPPFPQYTNQHPKFTQPPRIQASNSMEHGLLSFMPPHDKFDNYQHVTASMPMQTLRQPFQFWPALPPMKTLQPLPPLQPHQPFSSPMPSQRMSTIQPTRTNMDNNNIFASLQRASLHPVLTTKQYADFYQKNWNMFNN